MGLLFLAGVTMAKPATNMLEMEGRDKHSGPCLCFNARAVCNHIPARYSQHWSKGRQSSILLLSKTRHSINLQLYPTRAHGTCCNICVTPSITVLLSQTPKTHGVNTGCLPSPSSAKRTGYCSSTSPRIRCLHYQIRSSAAIPAIHHKTVPARSANTRAAK